VTVFLAVFAAGCKPPESAEEKAVRETFVSLRKALKDRDAQGVWGLLDAESRADAEREAKALKDAYARADDEGKAKLAQEMGLDKDEFDSLTGVGYLKTKRFHGKQEEIPESTIDKVTLVGKDEATVAYTEPDKDKEKLTFVRQGARWECRLTIPKALKP
jgi:hypothetical protein